MSFKSFEIFWSNYINILTDIFGFLPTIWLLFPPICPLVYSSLPALLPSFGKELNKCEIIELIECILVFHIKLFIYILALLLSILFRGSHMDYNM